MNSSSFETKLDPPAPSPLTFSFHWCRHHLFRAFDDFFTSLWKRATDFIQCCREKKVRWQRKTKTEKAALRSIKKTSTFYHHDPSSTSSSSDRKFIIQLDEGEKHPQRKAQMSSKKKIYFFMFFSWRSLTKLIRIEEEEKGEIVQKLCARMGKFV